MYIKIWCRSKMKIWCTSVKEFDVHRRRFKSYLRIQKNWMFTGDGFSHNSGFTKILCTPEKRLPFLRPIQIQIYFGVQRPI